MDERKWKHEDEVENAWKVKDRFEQAFEFCLRMRYPQATKYFSLQCKKKMRNIERFHDDVFWPKELTRKCEKVGPLKMPENL